MKKKKFINIILTIAMLLLIPFIAMQFTDQVNWTLFDFVIMGILLLSTGLLFEIAIQKITQKRVRIALYIAIIVVFLIIWAELAVGIFGTPFGGS